MGNSVLAGCGRYSDKLTEISKTIVEQRIKNGDVPSKNDIWEIDSQIFEAYQTILGTAKDSNVISKSIEYLRDSVEKGGSINDLNNLAISSVQKSINEQQKITEFKENASKVLETAGAMDIATDVIKVGTKILDNIFDENTLKEIDVQMEKAQTGDEKVAGEIDTYQRALVFLAKNPALNENSQKAALAWMKRLEVCDLPLAQKLIKDMALQYGFDILEETENGEKVVSKEKLDELIKEKIPEGNLKIFEKGDEGVRKLNEKAGKKAIEEGKFKGKTSKEFEEKVRKQIKDSNKVRLEELIEQYNKMQQDGASQENLLKIQRRILALSEVVKQREEKVKIEVKGKNEVDYDDAR